MGLFENSKQLGYKKWQAHRKLSATIHITIKELLRQENKMIGDIKGIIVFQGPGSFTGLRIGISVANALAYGLKASIIASSGDDWLNRGITQLLTGKNEQIILPEYGAPVHTTEQKH